MSKKEKTNQAASNVFNVLYIAFAITLFIILIYVIITKAFGSASTSSVEKTMVASYNLMHDDIPEPIQQKISEQGIRLDESGTEVSIIELATYDITGKVEAIEDYSTSIIGSTLAHDSLGGGVINKISPRDLTLSWGFLARSDDNVADHISISQNIMQRRVMLGFDSYLVNKYGKDKLIRSISNNHVIPIDDHEKNNLMSLKIGDIVRITGYLVDVKVLKGRQTIATWGPSSLSRSDMDDHACEIIYAEHIVKQKRLHD